MTSVFYCEPYARQRWTKGPLSPYLDGFAEMLRERGYSRGIGQDYCRRVGHWSIWLQRRGMSVGDIDEDAVRDHIRSWKRRTGTDISPAPLNLLLEHLRASGIARAHPPKAISASDRVINDYVAHLEQDRGLSQETIIYYRLGAQRCLAELYGDGPVRLSTLTAKRVLRYVLHHAQLSGPGYREHMLTVVRSFLQFLHMRGRIAHDLATSVPRRAQWGLTSVPGYLEPDEVQRLVQCCDGKTSKGIRDLAIIMLLVRLGLRSGEVRRLTLDDIDWINGRISVCGKGGKRSQLPLPRDVGEAIVRYLRRSRPRCATRSVFVRMRAPHRGLVTSSAIGKIVKEALSRAQLDPPHKGSHLLRHTCATQMLRRGASLDEIARILRHEDTNTTAVYAKVDLSQLQRVAQPWLGGVR